MTEKNTNTLDDRLIDEKAAANFLGYTPRFLQSRRIKGNGPIYIKLGDRAVRYRISDLVAWVENHKRTSTSN